MRREDGLPGLFFLTSSANGGFSWPIHVRERVSLYLRRLGDMEHPFSEHHRERQLSVIIFFFRIVIITDPPGSAMIFQII